jgi:hypothetical protein
LLIEFRRHANIPLRRALSLTDLKEFTYWLHKRRLEMWDPARVASDTRRGILKHRQLEQAVGVFRDWEGDPSMTSNTPSRKTHYGQQPSRSQRGQQTVASSG